MQKSNRFMGRWLLFASLCIIWGSSFVLMKLSLFDALGAPLLSPWQVGALRIGTAGLVLLPYAFRAFRQMQKRQLQWVMITGLLGSFFPAFLFCLAETQLDSAITGMLNAFTPICVLLVGAVVYAQRIPPQQVLGVALGFFGCLVLFLAQNAGTYGNWGAGGYVLLATVCYGLNVNMVKHHLADVPALSIAAVAFVFLIPPAFTILWVTGFFRLPLLTSPYVLAMGSAALLGVAGTALGSVIFYRLVKTAGSVFASLVTYGIPFVALGWGLVYGEAVSALQVLGLAVILAGVYFANRPHRA